MREFKAQYNWFRSLPSKSSVVSCSAAPGQTKATSQRNISQHCWVENVACVWPSCCDVLGVVAWLKFENDQIFHATFVDVARCCSRLARFSVQQCCARAYALVLFSTRNMPQHIATWWPNARNRLHPTLQSVAFKCCDRLAGACKCCANNVGICCVEMLPSFGRGLR